MASCAFAPDKSCPTTNGTLVKASSKQIESRTGRNINLSTSPIKLFDLEQQTGLPDYKPVSVLPVSGKRQPFLWAGNRLPALATYPEVLTERAAPAPLFGLAPHGVFPASRITTAAVRSYRTISPLPDSHPGAKTRRYIFCCTIRGTALKRPPRPLAGMLPYGDRTFLPHPGSFRRIRADEGGCPSGRPGPIIGRQASFAQA